MPRQTATLTQPSNGCESCGEIEITSSLACCEPIIWRAAPARDKEKHAKANSCNQAGYYRARILRFSFKRLSSGSESPSHLKSLLRAFVFSISTREEPIGSLLPLPPAPAPQPQQPQARAAKTPLGGWLD